MNKRTSQRLVQLAARVVKTGLCTKVEAKRLAASVLTQFVTPRPRAAKKKA